MFKNFTIAAALALALFSAQANAGYASGTPRATQAEAEAGTNTTKFMTPLRSYQQNTARIASQAEAEAGTDNTKIITPLRAKNTLQKYDLYPAGVQIGYTQCSSGALITGAATAMPVDDTIPQITEGGEILTCAYTGKVSGSKLEVTFNGAASSTAAQAACALFIDSTADAAAVQMFVPNSTATAANVLLTYTLTLADTSAHTYRIRCGNNGGTSILFNGFSAARKYGGVNYTTLTVREVK